MLLSVETLKFPLEKAVADHRRRLNMIAANVTGPRPGLDEQLREASAELLSAEIQALLEPFYREQVSAVATDAGKMKMLSEVYLKFMKFARDIVQEQAFLDGIAAAAISAARQVFVEIVGAFPSSHSSGSGIRNAG
jgi:mannose-1-phosphate guanylyltransferase